MRRNIIKQNGIILSVLALALFAPATLWAQNTGSISGLVKDSSGALIAGAAVTITNQSTSNSTTVFSQTDGQYLVPNLIPDLYTVAGEAKGFKRLAVAGLKLDAGANLTQDLVLEVGATTTIVNVTATASLVEATTNMQATTIDEAHMLELPLADREIFGLTNLTPGVLFFRSSDDISLNRAAQIVAAGASTFDTFPSLDGIDDGAGAGSASTVTGYVEVQPPPDALEEFRVVTNNMTAQYGHGALALVTAVSKSGGNQYHGDVYAFLRNDGADAAGWGNYNLQKPRLQQGSPGLTFGGPIFKNKTFFFFSYEYLFQNIAVSNGEGSVGLPAWYAGNFTTATRDAGASANPRAQVVPIYDPLTGDTQQISCNGVLNVICPNRISPVATKVLSFAPAANHAPTNPYNLQNNEWVFPINRTERPFYMGRLDQKIGTSDKAYFRYMAAPQVSKFAGGDSPAWGALNTSQHNWRTSNNVVLGYTHLFSPTFFVDASIGLQREWLFTGNYFNPTANNGLSLEDIGVLPTYVPAGFSIGGSLVPFDSPGGGIGRLQTFTNIPYTVDFTKVKGMHTFKFGIQLETYNQNAAADSGGTFTFNGTYTQGIANGAPIPNTGINLADFELGQYSAYSLSDQPSTPLRGQRYAGYFQDDLRLTPSLTFNLGLRYETENPMYSPHNALYSFNPSVPDPGAGTGSIPAGARGEMLFENLNGQGKYLWNWRASDGFQPRVGFAYRVGGKSDFVVRGGFAIVRTDQYINGVSGTAQQLGYSIGITQSYTPTNPSPFLGPTVIPASALVTPPTSALTPTFGNIGTAFPQSSIQFFLPNRLSPYVMQYNLNVQREWKGMLFDVGYIGTFGRHMDSAPGSSGYNINLIPPNLLGPSNSTTLPPLALRRPFTEFNGANSTVSMQSNPCCVSNYNALTFKTERRYANGFSWITAVTWSKWVGNTVPNGCDVTTACNTPSYQNIYNLKGEESLEDNDVPFRFVFSPLVELPFGKGKHWLNQGGVLNQVVGGWMAGFMGLVQAGSPLGPTVASGGTTYLNDISATLRPNYTPGCNPYLNKFQPAPGYSLGLQYLNPACFTIPANYTYGTQSRELPNAFGPGIAQFNLALSKNFYFKERYRLQIRAEAVDLFNTPTFSVPALSFNGSSSNGFGIIGSSSAATDGFTKRIMDFGMKFYF